MSDVWLVSYVALWVLFLVVAVVLLSVLRNLGTVYEAMQQPHPAPSEPIKLTAGEPLPDLVLEDLSGEGVSLATFRGQRSAFMVISPGCGPCRNLLEALAAPAHSSIDHFSAAQRVVISTGSGPTTADLIQTVGLSPQVPVLIDQGQSVLERWGVSSTPTTVVVDEHLIFREHTVGFTAPLANRAALATEA